MFPDVVETDRLRLQRFSRETIDTLDLSVYSVSQAEWRDAVGDEREAWFVEQ